MPAKTGPTQPAPCHHCLAGNPNIQTPFNFWVIKLRPKNSVTFMVLPNLTGVIHPKPPFPSQIKSPLSSESFLNGAFGFNRTPLEHPITKVLIFQGSGNWAPLTSMEWRAGILVLPQINTYSTLCKSHKIYMIERQKHLPT